MFFVRLFSVIGYFPRVILSSLVQRAPSPMQDQSNFFLNGLEKRGQRNRAPIEKLDVRETWSTDLKIRFFTTHLHHPIRIYVFEYCEAETFRDFISYWLQSRL